MKKAIIYYAIYILIISALAALFLGFSAAQTAKYQIYSYTVQSGDTYDILADRFEIKEDYRDWRERVKRLNGRDDSTLYTGETIYVFTLADKERN